ncbi:MAG: hypothetical protein Cons2KO_03590 [Congregibacter sp.]
MSESMRIEDYLSLRCRALNRQPVRRRGSDYVLCWLQQTLRGRNNPVLDAAILAGSRLRKPVLVYHGLGERYPYASDRFHTFILQASRALEADLSVRGVRFLRYVQRAQKPHPGLLYELASRASSIIVDDVAAFVGRSQAQRVAEKLPIAVLAVDGLRLIPDAALGGRLLTTPGFRARSKALRDEWLAEPTDVESEGSVYLGDLAAEHDALPDHGNVKDVVAACDVDHSVGVVAGWSGHRASALEHLNWAIHHVLPRYAETRNNPADTQSVSRLSPYLHFGVLSPREIALAVNDADVGTRHRWKFLDQLLTWREYYFHRARLLADPANYQRISQAGRDHLHRHRLDERRITYSLRELIRGETADRTWNAAQKQFVLEGWMHNNLRMYWGTQLIGWTSSPERAWTTACYLNDRFSLDGRDPATYGGIGWCFTPGRGSDAPVYGRVPQKSDVALRRRPGVDRWLSEQAAREIPQRLSIPDNLPDDYVDRLRGKQEGQMTLPF